MARAVLVAVVLLTLTFAGCLSEDDAATKSAKARGIGAKDAKAALGTLLTPSVEPLWWNPETFPHPAYNYPTLSNPPQGDLVNPWLKPIPAATLPSPIAGLKHVAQVKGTTSGAGMSLIGGIAILPSGTGTRFVDIRDPAHPSVVGTSPERSRGSDTIVYPNGRIIAVVATGGPRIGLIDITNPAAPIDLSAIITEGTHKVDVVPGTPIIYNSARGDIWDATNPEAPVKASKRMPATCHRTYFHIEPANNYFRAICAGYRDTHLWDITDPLDPKVIVTIPMWHAQQGVPGVTPGGLSHFAILNRNHKTLVVGDETGGGAAMACGAHASQGGKDYSTPIGALWFYDVSDEKNPKFKGWLAPRVPWDKSLGSSCTAHHGRLVPDPEGKRDLLAMGYYGAGVLLVDFTDAASARIVDQYNDNTSVWEAWYYNGYVFTGDGRRGLDTIGFR
jgi:hypothetical protein